MTRFLLIIILFFGLYEICPALEITFNQSAQVDDAVIRLGDVAKFNEQSPLADALATQSVGQAPAPGETLTLRSQYIKQYLMSNRSLSSDISWNGSPTIHISRQGVTISADHIQNIISEFFSSNKMSLPLADIKFIPNTMPLPFIVPKGDLTYDVIPSNPGILSSSSFSMIFKVDNRVVKNMSVRGKIEALAKVVVAAEPLKKGLILHRQHLNVVSMDISDIASPELHPQNLVGMQLTRTVAKGSPILGSYVDTLPVVRRGQKVKMVVESGSLHLTATGFAHSDGKLDQMIKVQNLNSNKTIHGRVAGPGIVEVIL
ncbi:MAG: flagellar basal body P-ring formation chaperone FlgA [Proteobacteria bacterium]|nr:flagellar basal body P-ring formation chaperone FlgA [Pseudomonadota bacterium]